MDDISSPLSRIQRKHTTQNELEHTFYKLNAFIEQISTKIQNRIQLVQHVYLEDYSTQVQEMTQELRSLREVLDEQLLRERSNERLFYLEEERDFFRGQVLKLTSELNLQKNANQALRKQLEEKEVERLNYHQIAFDLQKKAHKAADAAEEMRKVRQEPTSSPFSKLEPTDTHYTQKAITSKALASEALTSKVLTSRQLPSSFLKRKELDRGTGFGGVRSSSLQLIKKVSSNEDDRKEYILSSCIKEIKKQIFYRNLPLRQAGKIHFGEEERVGLERFTRGDKLGLLEKLLSNSEMVDLFQEFLAGHRKVVDAHQSTLLLNRQKAKFAKKIFDAKHTL